MADPSAVAASIIQKAENAWTVYRKKLRTMIFLSAKSVYLSLALVGFALMFRGGATFYASIWGFGNLGWIRCSDDNDSCGETGEFYSDLESDAWILWLRIYSEATHQLLFGLSLILVVWKKSRDGKTLGKYWIPFAWTLLPLLVSFGLSAFHTRSYIDLLQLYRFYICTLMCLSTFFLAREWLPRIGCELLEILEKLVEIGIKLSKVTKDNDDIMRQYDEALSLNQEVLDRIANRGRRRLNQAPI